MYNKLFAKILDSSVWLEATPARIVWITLLAAMDEDGYAHFSAIENLAARARVTTDEAQAAVDCFTAPDPDSEDQTNDGRRIERVPGGFIILNAGKYRGIVSRQISRERTRERVRRFRAKQCNGHVTVRNDRVTPSDTDTVSDTDKSKVASRPFDRFWQTYPKKVKKKTARDIWKRKKLDGKAETICADVEQRLAADARWLDGFIPDPTTYLNGERWEDELSEAKKATRRKTKFEEYYGED